MARARNKQQLLEFGEKELAKLLELVSILTSEQLTKKEVFENRTVKDVIAHLHAWHLLFLTWYKEGMAGNNPEKPAPGFTWKTTPELNEKLYQDYKDIGWKETLSKFKKSHKQIMDLIKKHNDSELEEKEKYGWTGSASLASYMASSTSSHYQWASSLIKKQF